MPIILTTTILVVPSYINNLGLLPEINFPVNLESFKFVYWIGYFLLILAFSSFYSTIVLPPPDISEQLQKMAVAIPGIRPGMQTTFYLEKLMKRITLIGATTENPSFSVISALLSPTPTIEMTRSLPIS